MAYLRNTWYVAAWADEVQPGQLVQRTLLGEPVLMFRNSAGEAKAIDDRCPHRFAPLSMGVHMGDSVECMYHGLRFAASGRCVHNPHHEGVIPAAARVKAYPLIERHQALWIWMGDPALADGSGIPDYSFVDTVPATAMSKGYLPTKCHYELLADNVMDLSHVDFLHRRSLGNGALSSVKATVADLPGDSVHIRWFAPNTAVFPAFDAYLPNPGTPGDQWADVHWHPPGLMKLENGASPAGRPAEEGVNTVNLHLVTPETELTTHYFFLNSRNFDVDNGAMNDAAAQLLAGVFSGEDKPMVEALQRYIGGPDLWAAKPVLLPIDSGAVRCRRVLQRLIASEQQET